MNANGTESILRSISNNQTLTDVTVNISGNEVGPQGKILGTPEMPLTK